MADSCGTEVVEDEVHFDSQNNIAHASATSSRVQLIQKPAGRRGNCWNAFVFIDGIDVDPKLRRAQCFHFKKATYLANSVNGTSNMNKHLKKCKPYIEFLKTNRDIPQFTQTRFRELLSRAIIRHGYAFSWVEHEGNREIHAYLNHQVQSITRNTAKADCLKLHKTLEGQLFKILQVVPGRICLTSDMWTSCQTEGYLCLTPHYVDAKWRLNKKLFLEYMPKGSNNSTEASSSTSNRRTSKRPKFSLADLDTRDLSDVTIKTKLDLYLEEPRLNQNANLNILEFWEKSESKYGELSSMVRDILSVPLTTVASESTFSIGGRILNKWRSSYLPENVEALIAARSWLYGYEETEEVECIGSEVDWTTKGRV